MQSIVTLDKGEVVGSSLPKPTNFQRNVFPKKPIRTMTELGFATNGLNRQVANTLYN